MAKTRRLSPDEVTRDWRHPALEYFNSSTSVWSGLEVAPSKKQHLKVAENALLRPAHPGSILIFVEGGVVAWLVARPFWDPTNATMGLVTGAVAFYVYSILYMIPYLNQALSVLVSLPWAWAAGYLVETYFNDSDHVDIWGARIIVFLVSAVAHWTLTESSG